MISPCKDCPDRSLGCHSECDKFNVYKTNVEKEKQYKKNYYIRRGEFSPIYYGDKYKRSN